MKKQIESELKEIASLILSNDSETDIKTLKRQAASLYEQLTVLEYTKSKLSVLAYNRGNSINEITDEPIKEKNNENFSIPKTVVKEPIITLDSQKPIVKEIPIELNTFEKISTPPTEIKTPSIESPDLLFELEELTAGFENLPEFEPAVENPVNEVSIENEISKINDTNFKTKSSLNEALNKGVNIGLNDRLAFVKHLFNNNQDDYTRVISQLNTLESVSGAKNFIEQMVKPEYNNWEGKEDFEKRFINIVFSKFDH